MAPRFQFRPKNSRNAKYIRVENLMAAAQKIGPIKASPMRSGLPRIQNQTAQTTQKALFDGF